MSQWPWTELGIDATQDERAIRKAYSTRLKQLDLDRQVQEYARLREARGYALYLARDAVQDRHEDVDYEPLGDAGQESSPGDDDALVYAPLNEVAPDAPQDLEPDNWRDDTPQEDKALAEAKAAWDRLGKLVFPDGEQSDDAFTLEEFEQAKDALQVLLDRAAFAGVNETTAIDYNLSEMLAAGWPRSAPLVEPANAEFNWFAEVGSINERPALMFLNARLVGMRFHEAVQRPDHEYHKVWKDLESGTTPIWIKRLTLKRDKVLEFIQIMRSTFPELENFLDADRVQQWENATTSSLARWIQIIAVIWFLQSAVAFCTQKPSSSDVIAAGTLLLEQQEAHFSAVVSDLLGVEWTVERLQQEHPDFASRLQSRTNNHRFLDPPFDDVEGKDMARDFVRQRMLLAREDATFEQKVALLQLNLQILKTAQAQGTEACDAALMWNDLTPSSADSETPAPVYEGETELLIELLTENKLARELQPGQRSWAIPGWLIGETIERSGLSEEQVRAGLRGDKGANRCTVMIALMESIARAPSKAPPELLIFP
ncbi:hypothetical protein [Altererythrobacter sp. GH1-8]|uniref:hypothetical protein n=1 Tax=Altererythrobacter sp. GH1-8 TaxID=3349333 RepID=UPI00374D2964